MKYLVPAACSVCSVCFALVVACNSSSSPASSSSSADANENADAGVVPVPVVDAGADAARDLDAGGDLASPFACGSNVAHEPTLNAAVYEALRAAGGFDFVEEHAFVRDSDGGTTSESRASAGTACLTANDKPACEAALSSIAAATTVAREALFVHANDAEFPSLGYYVLFSKGDVVGKISNTTELTALFPTVTKAVVAFFFAEASSYRVECAFGGWMREESDGFVLKVSKRIDQCKERDHHIVFMDRAATITIRDTVIDRHPPCL